MHSAILLPASAVTPPSAAPRNGAIGIIFARNALGQRFVAALVSGGAAELSGQVRPPTPSL
jgi:hypothetical protein